MASTRAFAGVKDTRGLHVVDHFTFLTELVHRLGTGTADP
jgi:hypothetical protein